MYNNTHKQLKQLETRGISSSLFSRQSPWQQTTKFFFSPFPPAGGHSERHKSAQAYHFHSHEYKKIASLKVCSLIITVKLTVCEGVTTLFKCTILAEETLLYILCPSVWFPMIPSILFRASTAQRSTQGKIRSLAPCCFKPNTLYSFVSARTPASNPNTLLTELEQTRTLLGHVWHCSTPRMPLCLRTHSPHCYS